MAATNRPTPIAHYTVSRQAYYATVLRDFYRIGAIPADLTLDPTLLRHALLTIRPPNECRERSTTELWLESVDQIMRIVIPYLPASDSVAVWQRLRASECYRRLNTTERSVFLLFGALARRNASDMTALAIELLKDKKIPHERSSYLLSVGMLGYLADRKPKEALQMWNTYAERAVGPTAPNILLRLLWAHSINATSNRFQN